MSSFAAVADPDRNRILVIGGCDDSGCHSRKIHQFDLNQETWTTWLQEWLLQGAYIPGIARPSDDTIYVIAVTDDYSTSQVEVHSGKLDQRG